MNEFIFFIFFGLAVAAILVYILWRYFYRKFIQENSSYDRIIVGAKKPMMAPPAESQKNYSDLRDVSIILKNISIGVKVCDHNGFIISSNMRDHEIFGVPEGLDSSKVCVYDCKELPPELFDCMKAGKEYDSDAFFVDFSKLPAEALTQYRHQKKWLRVNGYPIFESDGKTYEKYVIAVEDITEQKHLEQVIEEMNASANFSTEAGDLVLFGINCKTDIVYAISSEARIGNENTIEDYFLRIHSDDREKVVAIVDKLRKCTKDTIVECRYRFSDSRSILHNVKNCRFFARTGEDGTVERIICVHRDVTHEVKLTDDVEKLTSEVDVLKKKLAEAHETMNLAMNTGKIQLFTYDPSTEVFTTMGDTNGYTRNIDLKTITSNTDEDTAAMMRRYFKMFSAGELTDVTYTTPYIDPDSGEITFYSTNMRAVNKPDGSLDHCIGTVRDISSDVTAQKQVRLNNLRTRLALDASGNEYWEYVTEEQLFKRISGDNTVEYTDTLDYVISAVYALDMNETFRQAVNVLRNGIDQRLTLRLRMKSTSDENLHTQMFHLIPAEHDKHGKVTAYACMRRDITEEVKLQNEMAQKSAQIELALGAGHILPVTIDPQKNVVMIPLNNTIANQIFGAYPDEMSVTEFVRTLASGEDAKYINNALRYLADGDIMQLHRETSTTDNSGDQFFADLNFVGTNYNQHGKPEVIVGLVQNITEHRQLLAKLETATCKAEESNKLKSAFLANMSHEIRTPLNAIVGFSELLIDADDPDERREYCSIIENNNELLLHLIGDILDLSKIEAGMMTFKPVEFDLADVFDKSGKTMIQKCKNPDVRVIVENPYKQCLLTLDPNRMNQVWTNFVTNSIKYTPKGTITMGYKYKDGEIVFYVKDTGIGISDDKRDRVFKRFQKLDDFAQGTGLGLSIVKAIVEKCGGSVGFDSEYGKGSTFYARIPCEAKIVK